MKDTRHRDFDFDARVALEAKIRKAKPSSLESRVAALELTCTALAEVLVEAAAEGPAGPGLDLGRARSALQAYLERKYGEEA